MLRDKGKERESSLQTPQQTLLEKRMSGLEKIYDEQILAESIQITKVKNYKIDAHEDDSYQALHLEAVTYCNQSRPENYDTFFDAKITGEVLSYDADTKQFRFVTKDLSWEHLKKIFHSAIYYNQFSIVKYILDTLDHNITLRKKVAPAHDEILLLLNTFKKELLEEECFTLGGTKKWPGLEYCLKSKNKELIAIFLYQHIYKNIDVNTIQPNVDSPLCLAIENNYDYLTHFIFYSLTRTKIKNYLIKLMRLIGRPHSSNNTPHYKKLISMIISAGNMPTYHEWKALGIGNTKAIDFMMSLVVPDEMKESYEKAKAHGTKILYQLKQHALAKATTSKSNTVQKNRKRTRKNNQTVSKRHSKKIRRGKNVSNASELDRYKRIIKDSDVERQLLEFLNKKEKEYPVGVFHSKFRGLIRQFYLQNNLCLDEKIFTQTDLIVSRFGAFAANLRDSKEIYDIIYHFAIEHNLIPLKLLSTYNSFNIRNPRSLLTCLALENRDDTVNLLIDDFNADPCLAVYGYALKGRRDSVDKLLNKYSHDLFYYQNIIRNAIIGFSESNHHDEVNALLCENPQFIKYAIYGYTRGEHFKSLENLLLHFTQNSIRSFDNIEDMLTHREYFVAYLQGLASSGKIDKLNEHLQKLDNEFAETQQLKQELMSEIIYYLAREGNTIAVLNFIANITNSREVQTLRAIALNGFAAGGHYQDVVFFNTQVRENHPDKHSNLLEGLVSGGHNFWLGKYLKDTSFGYYKKILHIICTYAAQHQLHNLKLGFNTLQSILTLNVVELGKHFSGSQINTDFFRQFLENLARGLYLETIENFIQEFNHFISLNIDKLDIDKGLKQRDDLTKIISDFQNVVATAIFNSGLFHKNNFVLLELLSTIKDEELRNICSIKFFPYPENIVINRKIKKILAIKEKYQFTFRDAYWWFEIFSLPKDKLAWLRMKNALGQVRDDVPSFPAELWEHLGTFVFDMKLQDFRILHEHFKQVMQQFLDIYSVTPFEDEIFVDLANEQCESNFSDSIHGSSFDITIDATCDDISIIESNAMEQNETFDRLDDEAKRIDTDEEHFFRVDQHVKPVIEDEETSEEYMSDEEAPVIFDVMVAPTDAAADLPVADNHTVMNQQESSYDDVGLVIDEESEKETEFERQNSPISSFSSNTTVSIPSVSTTLFSLQNRSNTHDTPRPDANKKMSPPG